MNRNRLYPRLGGFVIMMAITACARSGQTAPPAPTADPNALATFAARTAQASALLTEQASIPTPIPPTSTPKISPITGTSLIVLEDQSALFIDHKADIQVTIPPGWLPVRVNEDEYYKAFALDVVVASPAITDRLTKIRSNNTDFFRLDAIDVRPDHVVNGIISDISVIFEADDFRSLEEWAQAEQKRVSPFEGFKFISSEFQQTADGTRVLVIEQSWNWSPNETVYYRGIFFSLPSGTVVLDFQTNLDFKDTVLPDFEQVVNSLTLLNP